MSYALVAHTRRVSVKHMCRCVAVLLAGFALIVHSSTACAATINHGNFFGPNPPGVSFLQVIEGSPTNDPLPLYDEPDASSGDLDFEPTDDFSAFSLGGVPDLTDGKLNFTIMSPIGITGVSLFERGDYGIDGVGGPNTKVTAFTNILATVTQINGTTPVNIILPVVDATFQDGLPPSVPGATWSLGLFLNVAAGLGPNQQATKVEIAINNRLGAFSEAQSVALIVKKDFVIGVEIVPEPTTIALIGLSLCAVVLVPSRLRRVV
jgi:hypothetical protein